MDTFTEQDSQFLLLKEQQKPRCGHVHIMMGALEMKMYSLLSFLEILKHATVDIGPLEWSNSQKQGLTGHFPGRRKEAWLQINLESVWSTADGQSWDIVLLP
jgi:hypothetical protein